MCKQQNVTINDVNGRSIVKTVRPALNWVNSVVNRNPRWGMQSTFLVDQQGAVYLAIVGIKNRTVYGKVFALTKMSNQILFPSTGKNIHTPSGNVSRKALEGLSVRPRLKNPALRIQHKYMCMDSLLRDFSIEFAGA